MKHIFLSLLVMMAATATAQKMQTVDKAGQPVPYASILNENGDIVGTTDINGVIKDVKGAKTVSITHVAYQPKQVTVTDGAVITLDDGEFGLPEVTVTKKPLVYAQTYYRILYICDREETPIYYYRTGVIDNSFNRKEKESSMDEDHYSVANKGLFKTVLNVFLGGYIKRIAGLKMNKVEDRMKKKYPELNIAFTPDGPAKHVITDKYGQVGIVTDNHDKGERRYSYEAHELFKHHINEVGSDKKKTKVEKREEREKNREEQSFIVYRIDEDGNYTPEDFVMQQLLDSYDDIKYNGHTTIFMQIFTTDRAYVTKDELKERKKANKMKMTFQNMKDFERTHNIPPLPEALQKRIEELANKD
jgi:hypothetical protein